MGEKRGSQGSILRFTNSDTIPARHRGPSNQKRRSDLGREQHDVGLWSLDSDLLHLNSWLGLEEPDGPMSQEG